VENVGARFKSDARALELLKQAQQAIGGDSAIRNIQSLSVTGKATKTFEVEGIANSEQGDWELNMQLPDKLSKTMRITKGMEGSERTESTNKVFTVTKKDGGNVTWVSKDSEKPQADVVIVKRGDGDKVIVNEENTNGDAKKEIMANKMRGEFEKHKQMELFRTALSLLLTAPQGVDADYIYAGDGSVDGASCDVIEARVGESSVKLFLDKSSHLPRMISYMDHKPMMMFRMKKEEGKTEENSEPKTFERKIEAPPLEEFQIKFADYRSVGGVMLPFKWTQTVGGRADETVDVSNYEINPANIADKFQELPQKIMMRTEKKQ
jgi:hypothetical protein